MRTARFVVVAAGLALLGSACGTTPEEPVAATTSGPTETDEQTPAAEVESEESDGDDGEDTAAESGELLPVPHVSEYDGTPPSGRIAFSVGQGGRWDLFVINADGTGLTQLTDEDGVDWSPSWSPDGDAIAFASDRAAFDDERGSFGDSPSGMRTFGLYLVDVDGREVSHLLGGWEDRDRGQFSALSRAHNAGPAWAPDGARIAFRSDGQGSGFGIHVIDVPGGETTRLTDPELHTGSPAWAPDGRRLAFAARPSDDEEADRRLMVVDVDGTDPTVLSDLTVANRRPGWSPDGTTLAVPVGERDHYDLYLVDVDSGEFRELLSGPGAYRDPTWSPDGEWIAFWWGLEPSSFGTTAALYVVRADGTDLLRLTDGTTEILLPDWAPASP